jgi:gas vesicle protein
MSKAKFALGALIGAVAGVVAGILTAPKPGKETRADIKRKAAELKGAAVQHADEMKVRSEEATSGIKEKVSEYKQRSEQAVDGAIEGAKKGFYSKK